MTRSLSLMACAICRDSALSDANPRALGYLDVEQTTICPGCAGRIRRGERTAPATDSLVQR